MGLVEELGNKTQQVHSRLAAENHRYAAGFEEVCSQGGQREVRQGSLLRGSLAHQLIVCKRRGQMSNVAESATSSFSVRPSGAGGCRHHSPRCTV